MLTGLKVARVLRCELLILCTLTFISAIGIAFERPNSLYTEDVKLSSMVVLAAALMTGCKSQSPGPSFDSLAEDFVYGTLALSPVSATQAGYHQHKGVQLDEALDDYSPQGMRNQRQF